MLITCNVLLKDFSSFDTIVLPEELIGKPVKNNEGEKIGEIVKIRTSKGREGKWIEIDVEFEDGKRLINNMSGGITMGKKGFSALKRDKVAIF